MQPPQPVDTTVQRTPSPRTMDDDISLVDVALIIWRRRRTAAAALGIALACGVWAMLRQPNNYSYVTTIEVGSRVEEGRTVPIESTDTTLAKLKDSYVPAAQQRHLENHPDDSRLFDVTVGSPKNSQLVVLRSTAPEAGSAPYRQIQEQAMRDLLADHARVFDTQRMAIKLQKQRTEAALQALGEDAKMLTRQVDRLQRADQLLEQQITDTRALIDAAGKNRIRAIGEARDETRAMTMLMLDNEVRASRARLADLQHQLQIGQADKLDELQNSLRANTQQQALQRTQIQQIDLQLANLQETRSLGVAIRSPRPVGRSPSLIVALSLVLGGILAVLLPLALEFVDRVRQAVAAAHAGEINVEAAALADQQRLQ